MCVREKPEPLHEAILAWQVLASFQLRYILPDPRSVMVRQDDLAGDPSRESSRLFSFLGIDRPPGLDRFLDNAFSARAGSNVDGDRSYIRRNAREVVGKWRMRLSPAQQARIREATEQLAAKFGYTERDW